VFYRDTRFVMTFILNVSFFLTPIFFTVDFMKQEYQWLLKSNPFYILIHPFRTTLYMFNWDEFINSMYLAVSLIGLIVFAAYAFWKRKLNELYFHL
jgi:lipopolysaccharide transport system permease protein